MSIIRPPAVAGRFYPADEAQCARALKQMFHKAADVQTVAGAIGGIMPHAGWYFSGVTAARTVQALSNATPDVVVIFGAVHVSDLNRASVFDRGAWQTPMGMMPVDEELAAAVVESVVATPNPQAHRFEHSIEVELPFIQHVFGDIAILPVMVRPGSWSAEIGHTVAQAAERLGRRAIYLASTDLTHYGPSYGFEPHGRGGDGLRWAKQVNDRRFLDCVGRMGSEEVVPEAEEHRNACGAGAVAATLAAVTYGGGANSLELSHVTSADVLAATGERSDDAVGYAATVFFCTQAP
ncbi:MAG: AmmeMemoRadiSam system protein B [Planctomycetes bacterium]|nr:AmmeMemoRadiSam system protein B [Planctomycetota bacterium]